jgi:hypothetical protein
MFPAWKLQPGENYADTFVRGIDWAALSKGSICLNYHVREIVALCANELPIIALPKPWMMPPEN